MLTLTKQTSFKIIKGGTVEFDESNAIYILNEPNWIETTIELDELKRWLKSRGITPEFFFPEGAPDGFRDPKHTRYSAKLACAVAAWETVKSRSNNKSVKATIEEWVRANAAVFDMVGPDGLPTENAIQQVAQVVNWDPSGGAVPTGGDNLDMEELEAADPERRIENFPRTGATLMTTYHSKDYTGSANLLNP